MGSMAFATIVGHLTRDAELKYSNSGTAICAFSIATNSRVNKGGQWVDEPNFWDVALFGKKAESVNQYLTKGKLVAVSGDMRQDKWEKDGQPRMKVAISASDVQLLSSGDGQGRAQTGQSERRPAERPSNAPARRDSLPARNPGDDFQDDIPF